MCWIVVSQLKDPLLPFPSYLVELYVQVKSLFRSRSTGEPVKDIFPKQNNIMPVRKGIYETVETFYILTHHLHLPFNVFTLIIAGYKLQKRNVLKEKLS